MPEVVVKGTKIHYLESKARETGKQDWPIVLIHGSGGNGGVWKKAMDSLAENYDAIAVDLPGHGASQGEGSNKVSTYRDFMRDFLDALSIKLAALGGHSLGGAIAQDFALHYPEVLKAVLLIGTGARLRVLPEALEMSRKMAFGEIQPKFYSWGFADKASPEIIAEGEREWAKTGSRVRYYDFLACDQFDIMGEVEKIRMPALILCGKEDRLTPVKYSEFLNRKIAGSRMQIIESAGHMIMLENPKALCEAIQAFLGSL